jgi:hypothetical protein
MKLLICTGILIPKNRLNFFIAVLNRQ